MRSVAFVVCVLVAGATVTVMTSNSAFAVCKTMRGTHNGTNMFHETGAQGAAVNKLINQVDALKLQNPKRRVRMGRVRTKCGPWFNKYLLPHRHCVAQARVCY